MKTSQVQNLLLDLWDDLQDPTILWQTVAACALLAWGLERQLRWRAPDASPPALKLGAAGYRRILFPLLAMLLLAARAGSKFPFRGARLGCSGQHGRKHDLGAAGFSRKMAAFL